MSFPESLAAALFLIALAVVLIVAIARAGTNKGIAYRNFLRDATPGHHQGREADFDSHGRPY